MASPSKPAARQIAAFCTVLALLLVTGADALRAASQLDQAREYYDQAMQAEAQLEQVPIALRPQATYDNLIQAFRRVYLTAPAYGNDTLCLMDVGELSEGAALLFNQPKYFQSAIAAYRFLLHEYPNSQFRFEARLNVARIYREDLHQPREALKEYQQFLSEYPHSAQSKQVQAAVAQLEDELGSKSGSAVEASAGSPGGQAHEMLAGPHLPAVQAAVSAPPAKVSLPPPEPPAAIAAAPPSVEPAPVPPPVSPRPVPRSAPVVPVPGPVAVPVSAPASAALPALASAAASTLAANVGASDAARPTPTAPPALISDVHYWTAPGDRRIVLDIERKVDYHIGRMAVPRRLFIDLDDTRVSPPSGKTMNVADELLQRVRLAQYKTGVCRLVLDLGSTAQYQVSEMTNPYRLVIDIHSPSTELASGAAQISPVAVSAASQRATAASASAPRAAEVKTAADGEDVTVPQTVLVLAPSAASSSEPASSAVGAPAVTSGASAVSAAALSRPSARVENGPPARPAAPAGPELAAKAPNPMLDGAPSLTRALGLKIRRIVIDPGHGGHDTGTIGPGGLEEKDLTLDLAQRLGKLLEERLGSDVIYTRDDDTFVPLEDRSAVANQAGADLFLSIHANSSSVPRVSGVETYYLSLTSDPGALAVAARENATSEETVSDLQGLVSKIALNEKVDESRELALHVQSALQKSLAGTNAVHFNRGVKKAPFVVLIGAKMPSILAEVSFLSNPDEEKRLRTPEYREKIAEALYKGIAAYVQTTGGVKPAPAATASAAPSAQTASLQ